MLNFLFRSARARTRVPASVARRRSFVPRLEALESRSLPSTLTVTNLADSGAGSLRDRLAAAAPGDTVAFAPGLSGTVFLGSALDVTTSLTVQGPGADALTLYGQQATQVFHVTAGTTAGISGLTVAGGFDWQGGGIHNDGSLTLDRVTVRDNQAGGAAFLTGSGGGIYNAPGASLTITRSTISDNTAHISNLQGGGGIYNGGALSVFATTFSGNWLSSGTIGGAPNGSAVYNALPDGGVTPTAVIDSCTFTANDNNSLSSWGNLTLQRSTVSGDRLVGIECGGTATIDSCTVTGNGDGVEAGGSLTLVNSTVAGNQGAGLNVRRGNNTRPTAIAIANCTIAGNTYYSPPSADSGAGIDVFGIGTTTVITLHNTILAGNVLVPSGGTPILKDLNTATFTSILVASARYESLGYNLIQAPGSATIAGTTTGNLLGIDPLLGPLADNGGPTRTMALLPGSPAIDAGDGTGAPALDQRGFTRAAGTASDIGAFEVQPATQVTRLSISAPAGAVAGSPFTVTVQALNDFGAPVPRYTGTVHFTGSDGQAILPPDYTFAATDPGTLTFPVTLKTAGTQSLTVAGTTPAGSVTATAGGIVVTPAAAVTLRLSAPAAATVGQAVSVRVTLLDACGNRATGYTGTVRFASSDASAALPANYSFTSADAGMHTFSVTLKKAGTQSITATDVVTASLTATAGGVIVSPAAAANFVLTAPASVVHGVPFSLTLTVQDAYGNVVTGYTGTVRFTSSDRTATLPASYTFTATDAGAHTFVSQTMLRRKGTQTLTVTDLATSALTATDSINVT
jgi:hypothetical protein